MEKKPSIEKASPSGKRSRLEMAGFDPAPWTRSLPSDVLFSCLLNQLKEKLIIWRVFFHIYTYNKDLHTLYQITSIRMQIGNPC